MKGDADETERHKAFLVNALGVRNVAVVAQDSLGCPVAVVKEETSWKPFSSLPKSEMN